MRRRASSPRSILCCAAFGCALSGAGPALASGFAAAEFGGEHGNVVTTNPTALYFNPAGIAFSDGTRLYASGVFGVRRGSWHHARGPTEAPEPSGAEGANTGEASFTNVLAAPALGATTWLGPVAVGGALYVPFGGRVDWKENARFADHAEFPLAADGVQRWHIIEGSVSAVHLTLGAAMRFGPIALGVTGNLIRSALWTRQARSFNAQQAADPLNEGRVEVDVSGFQASLGLGAMGELVRERLWAGASYQTQPGFGPIELDGTLSLAFRSDVASRRITYTHALPDILRAGVRFRPVLEPRVLELRAYGDFTRWSRLQTQCISIEDEPCAVYADGTDATPGATVIQNLRRKWNDTFGVNAGASYWIAEAVELFAGVGFATAATPDATLDPMMPDSESVRLSLGSRLALPAAFHLSVGVTSVQYADRDNTGESTLSDFELPTRRPDGGGRYSLWLGLLHVAVEKEF